MRKVYLRERRATGRRTDSAGATGCDKLKSRDDIEQGRCGLQERQVRRCGGASSRRPSRSIRTIRTRALYLATAYMIAVDSGRRFAGEPAVRHQGEGRVHEGAGEESERYDRAGVAGIAGLQPGRSLCRWIKSWRSSTKRPSWYTKLIDGRSEEQGSVLQPGCHRVGEVVSRADDGARRTADEARRSRSAEGQEGQG